MKTALARVETQVPEEDRIARIESDVSEIKDDVKTLNVRLNDSIVANAREFGAVRTELAEHRATFRAELAEHRADTEKGFSTLRAELADHRTDTEKGFGALRAEIEKTRTLIESTKFQLFTATLGAMGALLGIMVYLHTLKIL